MKASAYEQFVATVDNYILRCTDTPCEFSIKDMGFHKGPYGMWLAWLVKSGRYINVFKVGGGRYVIGYNAKIRITEEKSLKLYISGVKEDEIVAQILEHYHVGGNIEALEKELTEFERSTGLYDLKINMSQFYDVL